MCGRVRLSSDVSEIKIVFSIPPDRPTPNIAPSWNVAPTDPLPVDEQRQRHAERNAIVVTAWEIARQKGATIEERWEIYQRERDLSLPGPHDQVPSRLYLPNGNLSATFPAARAHCFISNLPASVELLKVLSPQHWSAENRHGCCQGGVLLDHVSVGVSDIDRSRRFYDATLRPLGLLRIVDFGDDRGSDYGAAPGPLGVEFTITREAAVRTPIPGAHLCFRAPDRAAVDAFHLAALANGGRDDGKPGLRPDYHAHYYGAFVLDPDGHRIEAVCHAPQSPEVVAAG